MLKFTLVCLYKVDICGFLDSSMYKFIFLIQIVAQWDKSYECFTDAFYFLCIFQILFNFYELKKKHLEIRALKKIKLWLIVF